MKFLDLTTISWNSKFKPMNEISVLIDLDYRQFIFVQGNLSLDTYKVVITIVRQ